MIKNKQGNALQRGFEPYAAIYKERKIYDL